MSADPPGVTTGIITLWQIDLGPVGGPMLYFCSLATEGVPVLWGGQEYTPIPMEISGIETNVRGSLPQPTVSISNIYGAGNALADEYKDLVGAFVTRKRTLARFLDDGETPDANAFISSDTYVVTQKTSQTSALIVFKLSSVLDQPTSKIPRRLVLRSPCSHIYRFWDAAAGAFDYRRATCPYTGSAYFDVNDTPSSAAADQCSRQLTGCQNRFPGVALPGRFFPGVGRLR